MERKRTSRLVEWLFSDRNPSRIFARGFHWLIYHPENLCFFRHPEHAHARRSAKDAARKLPLFPTAYGALRLAAACARGESLEKLEIPHPVVALLREGLGEALDQAAPEQVFPALLCVLEGIDLCYGPVIRQAYTKQARFGDAELELDEMHALPLPEPQTDPDDAHKHRPPIHWIRGDHARLESYFSYVTATPPVAELALHAALHRSSFHADRSSGRSGAMLRVGLLDVLCQRSDLAIHVGDAVYWVPEFMDRSTVLARLEWALKLLAEQEEPLDLIVLPELSSDPGVACRVADFVRDQLVRKNHRAYAVLGSLHVRDAGDGEGCGQYRNALYMASAEGLLEWSYWKYEAMDLELAPGFQRREALGRPPRHVVAIDTPFGRLCPVICKDFITDHVLRQVVSLRANVIVVPCMTRAHSVSQFWSIARNVAAANLATTVFANSSLDVRERAAQRSALEAPLGFIHPGARCTLEQCPRHLLPEGPSTAIAAVYEVPLLGGARESAPRVHWTNDGLATEHGRGLP
jgi:predicted amidohydrolase